ncbi:MAG TPA: hypothetical protein VMJ70_06590 [Candidatus Sulfotelmatobacter sp.]|nr:hypothetical protein [Candidatus Sulfotelmatobacter sp.]
MKKFFVFLLVCFAAWYGWKHYPELLKKRGGDEAVIVNNSGHPMERVRLTVDGQTYVKEALPENDKASFEFEVANDATFELEWQYSDAMGVKHWSGGMVPRGPMLQRHTMTVDGDGEVLYQAENK